MSPVLAWSAVAESADVDKDERNPEGKAEPCGTHRRHETLIDTSCRACPISLKHSTKLSDNVNLRRLFWKDAKSTNAKDRVQVDARNPSAKLHQVLGSVFKSVSKTMKLARALECMKESVDEQEALSDEDDGAVPSVNEVAPEVHSMIAEVPFLHSDVPKEHKSNPEEFAQDVTKLAEALQESMQSVKEHCCSDLSYLDNLSNGEAVAAMARANAAAYEAILMLQKKLSEEGRERPEYEKMSCSLNELSVGLTATMNQAVAARSKGEKVGNAMFDGVVANMNELLDTVPKDTSTKDTSREHSKPTKKSVKRNGSTTARRDLMSTSCGVRMPCGFALSSTRNMSPMVALVNISHDEYPLGAKSYYGKESQDVCNASPAYENSKAATSPQSGRQGRRLQSRKSVRIAEQHITPTAWIPTQEAQINLNVGCMEQPLCIGEVDLVATHQLDCIRAPSGAEAQDGESDAAQLLPSLRCKASEIPNGKEACRRSETPCREKFNSAPGGGTAQGVPCLVKTSVPQVTQEAISSELPKRTMWKRQPVQSLTAPANAAQFRVSPMVETSHKMSVRKVLLQELSQRHATAAILPRRFRMNGELDTDCMDITSRDAPPVAWSCESSLNFTETSKIQNRANVASRVRSFHECFMRRCR